MSPIYLDYNATTPVAPEVRDAILPFLAEHYGNPSSSHSLGIAAHEAVENARAQVAQLFGAENDEIVFTSSGTESNNLALVGYFHERQAKGHLIISAIEHPAVTEPAAFLKSWGHEVTVVGCDNQGVVDPEAVKAALKHDTVMVSIMHANNEIGALQPIRQISEFCRERGVLVHADAAQSIGKTPVNVNDLGVDLLSLAGHKVYAPKGVGALYVRRGIKLAPVTYGAGHERGLRPGTENVPYIAGLGRVAELIRGHVGQAETRLAKRRDRLYERLAEAIGPRLTVNGANAPRLPNTLSVNFPDVVGSELLAKCPCVCASTGAACHSGTTKLSATLEALGLDPEVARGTVRLSVGWYTTEEEIEQAADMLIEALG